MEQFWVEVLDFAESTTQTIGQQLLANFGHAQAEQKADGSLVTESDQWADEKIRAAIAQVFPTHGVLSEEAKHKFPSTDWCWIIDPIDGTTNFTRGIPLWGISLGLLYQGTPVFGHVYFPPIQQRFHGYWLGNSGLNGSPGAFLNHQVIHTSPDKPSGTHFFSLCARSTDVMRRSFPCKIRMLGVATYNILTVAAGISLGAVEATPKIWDIAAVWPIIQAAGGTWTALDHRPIFPLSAGENYRSRPFPTLISSQQALASQFEPLVTFLGQSGK
ncbi:MAG: inositol monophosphatase family protein [Cyanobacteria bacterium P01_A01_bin.123]